MLISYFANYSARNTTRLKSEPKAKIKLIEICFNGLEKWFFMMSPFKI